MRSSPLEAGLYFCLLLSINEFHVAEGELILNARPHENDTFAAALLSTGHDISHGICFGAVCGPFLSPVPACSDLMHQFPKSSLLEGWKRQICLPALICNSGNAIMPLKAFYTYLHEMGLLWYEARCHLSWLHCCCHFVTQPGQLTACANVSGLWSEWMPGQT